MLRPGTSRPARADWLAARCRRAPEGSGNFVVALERGGTTLLLGLTRVVPISSAEEIVRLPVAGGYAPLQLSNRYRCPYCSAPSVVRHDECHRITCWDGRSELTPCGWCPTSIIVDTEGRDTPLVHGRSSPGPTP